LFNAYNIAHGDSIQALPVSVWSIPSELVIKKGEQYSLGEITVNNTTALNFDKQYAIGISITGVSNGTKVADKLGDIFIVFRVQNAMDG